MIAYDIFSYSDTGWFMNALSFFNSTNNKILVTIILVLLLIIIIEIVALWGIFTKAKKPGFISLIPVVNVIYLLKIAKMKAYHFILMCIPVIGLYFWYRLSMNLAQVFKKKPIFGWGLFFLNPIFLIILGFGDAEYDKDYYYTEVEETPPTKEVIASNRMVFEDYNQGLVFDPSQNVDDVVTSAPITNDNMELFEKNSGQEELNMAFQDMSEAATNNANSMGGVPEIGSPQTSSVMGMTISSPEPPKPYSATPNTFFMPQSSQNVNITPEVPVQSETTNMVSKFGAEPQKMTVEQLLGLQPSTEQPTPQEEKVVQSNIDANNLFGIQLQEDSVENTPSVSPTEKIQLAPMNEMLKDSIPTAGNEETTKSTSLSSMPANASDTIQNGSLSQDINQILGVNPNELQAVPITSTTVATPSTQENSSNVGDDISKILGINPNDLEAVPIVQNTTPIVPQINVGENVTVETQTLPIIDQPQNTIPVTEPVPTSSVLQPANVESQEKDLNQPNSTLTNESSSNINEIDINSLLGLDMSKANSDNSHENISSISDLTTAQKPEVREVTNIESTMPAMLNNATAVADTIPAATPSQSNFNLDNFLSNNQIDAEPNQTVSSAPVGQIQSFVGQLEPSDSIREKSTLNNFVEKEEKVVESNKICQNCGAKLPQEAKFCYLCGKQL